MMHLQNRPKEIFPHKEPVTPKLYEIENRLS